MRKTVSVDDLKKKVNSMLKDSTCSPDVRRGMYLVLETALNETENYRGFSYLPEHYVPEGHLPGVNVNADGTIPDLVTRFANTDETRRHYI